MDKVKIKDLVLRIVRKNLHDINDYKLFLFGPYFVNPLLQDDEFDVGIDSNEEINPVVKMRINRELDLLPTNNKVTLIDFSRVENSLKEKIVPKCEYIVN